MKLPAESFVNNFLARGLVFGGRVGLFFYVVGKYAQHTQLLVRDRNAVALSNGAMTRRQWRKIVDPLIGKCYWP